MLRVREKASIYIYISHILFITLYIDARMRQDCATHFLVEHASIFYKIIARGLLSNNDFQLAQAHSGPKPAGANSPFM